MKKKNLYYTAILQRKSMIKLFILNFFLGICSVPRSFIENFTRISMGRRYFSFSLCIIVAIVLAGLPFIWGLYDFSFWNFIGHNLTWYAYLFAYVHFAIKRNNEIDRTPGSYDFKKYSKSEGKIHPLIANLKIMGEYQPNRLLAIIYEPGIFLALGILMIMFHQPIGLLLTFSAIVYSVSWVAQYHIGEEFILDKIDELIVSEEMVNTFVHEMPSDETRGFEFYGPRPSNSEFRRKVVNSMFDEEPAVDVS